MMPRPRMAAEVPDVVRPPQQDTTEALFGRAMGLQFSFQLLIRLDTVFTVTVSLDQGIGIATLTIMAFSQGFEDVHGQFLNRLRRNV